VILALKSVLIGYFVVWLVLLIACIRRREFCAVFSNSQRTRWFWLATFVFLNPLLTILYLIYGQFRSPQARPIHIVRDVALVIILAGFFVNFPGVTHLWMQPFLGRSARAVPGAAEAHLAVIEARNDTNSSNSTSSSDNSRLACRHLAVILEGGSPLLHRVGSELVEQLKTIPAVESVDLQPDGKPPISSFACVWPVSRRRSFPTLSTSMCRSPLTIVGKLCVTYTVTTIRICLPCWVSTSRFS
jgi:hypothetical protein